MANTRRSRRIVLLFLPLALSACGDSGTHLPLSYPEAHRSDHTDEYFGTVVADPFRWMEEMEATEVTAWVDAQNELAVPFLGGLPGHAEIRARLTGLWNFERFGIPVKGRGLYFFTQNDGLQDQDVLYFGACI